MTRYAAQAGWRAEGCTAQRRHKGGWVLSRLQQFWLDAVAPLAALLESAEAGDLMPEKAVSATQTALYIMGNAHQQMAQERRKKLILKLN